MRIVNVTTPGNFCIEVSFEDNTSGIINLKDLVQKGVFRVLQDASLFKKVYTDGHSIAWSDDLEIDADNIYPELANKKR